MGRPQQRKPSRKPKRPLHIAKFKGQPVPLVAYEDPKFMESLGARPLRIIAEYLDPLARLRRANVGDTIVMFGSARIQSREKALAHLKRVQKDCARPPLQRVANENHRRPIAARNVPLLRRGPRARAQNHVLGDDARQPAAPLRDLLRRRPRHHGSRQSRRCRSRRPVGGPQHPAPARANRPTPTSRTT